MELFESAEIDPKSQITRFYKDFLFNYIESMIVFTTYFV